MFEVRRPVRELLAERMWQTAAGAGALEALVTVNAATVDAMIVDYLAQAMAVGYRPSTDRDPSLAAEREAAFRLFLWGELSVTPTVITQLSATPDVAWRNRLQRLVIIHLSEPQLALAAGPTIEARTAALSENHRDGVDCRIVAEAEFVGAEAFITFDRQLLNHLGALATVPILTPSGYWRRLAIARGTRWAEKYGGIGDR